MLQPLRPQWEFVTYAGQGRDLPSGFDAFDGLLITGSPASVHDERDWIARLFELIRQARVRAKPMIGALFRPSGDRHGARRQSCRQPAGWGLGATTTTFFDWRSWMTPRHETLRLYCGHNEQVRRLPEGAVALGRDPIAEISAFALGDGVFCTQHHPEMTPDYIAGLIAIWPTRSTRPLCRAPANRWPAARRGWNSRLDGKFLRRRRRRGR